MKQFDYRKFLKENKSTFHSSLNEDVSATARKFAQHISKKEGKKFTVTPGSVDEKSFDLDLDGEEYMGGSYLVKDNGDIVNVAAGNEVYGNVNQLEEGEAAYEYEKGKKAGEKMKKSELKAKIKEMIVSEMNIDVTDETGAYDFLAELESMLEQEEEEAADDVTDDTEIDVTTDVEVDEVNPNVKAVQDALTQAQAAAQKLGDPKLTDQIGNTITFFTRAHVVEKPKGAVSESDMDSFGSSNDIQAVINQLIQMGPKGKQVLSTLQSMDEWNGLVQSAVDEEPMDSFDMSNDLLSIVNQLIDAGKQDTLNVLNSIDAWQELMDSASMYESKKIVAAHVVKKPKGAVSESDMDSFGSSNDIQAVINQLIQMGPKGKQVLSTLQSMDEWNGLVQSAVDEEPMDSFDMSNDLLSIVNQLIDAGKQDTLNVLNSIDAWQELMDSASMYESKKIVAAHVVKKPKGAMAEGEEMKEGYFGANNEVEELIDTLGYETLDEFFSDNPGVITVILDWAAGVPEFRRKMIDNGLLEAKKENMNESMFPILKKILK